MELLRISDVTLQTLLIADKSRSGNGRHLLL